MCPFCHKKREGFREGKHFSYFLMMMRFEVLNVKVDPISSSNCTIMFCGVLA